MPSTFNNCKLYQKWLPSYELAQQLFTLAENAYYDKKNGAVVIDRLCQIFNLGIEALKSFREKKLRKFDAHVGETACHIRAAKILFLCDANLDVINEIRKLMTLSEHLQSFKNSIPYLKCSRVFYLKSAFENFNAFFSGEIIYLIQCYFLNRCSSLNKNKFPNSINRDEYIQLKLSKKIYSDLIRQYQKNISRLSVDFVYSLSARLQKDTKFISQVKSSEKAGHANRTMLPLFTALKIISEHLIFSGKPIVFRIKSPSQYEMEIAIRFDKNQKPYVYQGNLSSECFVIYGVTSQLTHSIDNYFQEIAPYLEHLSIIDMNTSTHPQFPDNSDYIIPTEYSPNFKQAQLLSRSLGCTKENNQLFTIQHVYADVLDNVINKAPNTNSDLKKANVKTCLYNMV